MNDEQHFVEIQTDPAITVEQICIAAKSIGCIVVAPRDGRPLRIVKREVKLRKPRKQKVENRNG